MKLIRLKPFQYLCIILSDRIFWRKFSFLPSIPASLLPREEQKGDIKYSRRRRVAAFYPREPSLGHPGPVNVIELMLVLLRIPTIYGTVTATISRITVLKTGGIRKNEEKKMV